VVERRSGFLVIRSPSNPEHFWGNLLLFDDAPLAGDALRWEALFAEVFGDEPRVRHRTFAWDRTDGVFGAAREEFAARGYDIEESIGLVAGASDIQAHPRENREVIVQVLDPAIGADEALWDGVLERLTAELGPERLVFGSDVPFVNPALQLGGCVLARLGHDDKEQILGRNAANLFRIDTLSVLGYAAVRESE